MKTKICKFCGKEFVPNSSHQIYCKGPHYRICPVCGKQYEEKNVENLKRPPVACSYACRARETRETSLKKYGCKAPGNNKEARKKASETMMKNLGVPYAMQSEDVRNKSEKTLIKKYGVDNAGKNQDTIDKRMKTCKERYGNVLPFNRPESYSKQHKTMKERYGVPYFVLSKEYNTKYHNKISKINQKFHDKLLENSIESEYEFVIDKFSYDLHILDTNILIEIDPTYTHNAIGNHWNSEGLDMNYHLEKTRVAQENGYRCIHVFDWDDWDKIIDMLLPRKTIYARNLDVWRLTREFTNEFLKKYHLQGSCKGQVLSLGLVKDNICYTIMTFGRSRYDKSHDIELLRLCSSPGYTIIGGASKLFKYAVKTYEIDSIISYCDISKFTGDVYEKLNMKLIRTTRPQEVWSKENKKITANLLRQRGFDQLFHTQHGKGQSNELLMLKDQWLPIYDCGQQVWEYRS